MLPNTPRLTILLPFYQAGEEMDPAIRSLVQQSFSSWKLILVSNNGSITGLDIARKWIATDKRITMLEEPKQGIAHALNHGLRYVDTPYIARMDADDISFPERLKQQVDILDYHQDIDVVSCQTVYQSHIPGSEGYSLFVDWQNAIISPDDHARERFVESPIAHPTVVFRKELIDRYGPYDTDEVPEDYELWLRWMDQGVRIYKILEPLLTWIDHSNRLSRTHENYSREAFYRVKCYYLARWIKSHIPPQKKIIVCGSSRIGRKRASMLEQLGVTVYGYTDVKKRPNRQVRFIHYSELTEPEPWFLINFIARRGVGKSIREHFTALDFVEEKDFILAG